MSIEGIVFGNLTDMGDHFHLEWDCPDCGSFSFVRGVGGPCRFVCSMTSREFLVLQVELQPKVSLHRKQRKYAA